MEYLSFSWYGQTKAWVDKITNICYDLVVVKAELVYGYQHYISKYAKKVPKLNITYGDNVIMDKPRLDTLDQLIDVIAKDYNNDVITHQMAVSLLVLINDIKRDPMLGQLTGLELLGHDMIKYQIIDCITSQDQTDCILSIDVVPLTYKFIF